MSLQLKFDDLEMSRGNTKLPKTTAIFNLSSATDCPSRKLGLCKLCGKCYALKAERQYKQVKPYRDRQEKYWKYSNASAFAVTFRNAIVKMRKKPTHIRFNEAGDFHSQECVDKMEDIARMLKHDGTTCYVYTARQDLDFSKCKALTINGSGFRPTPEDNIFQAVEELPVGELHCAGNCRKCTLCTEKKSRTIYIKIH